MKHRYLVLLLIVFTSNILNAKQVDQKTALQVAIHFYTGQPYLGKGNPAKFPEKLSLARIFYRADSLGMDRQPAIYVFNIPGEQGFVIVSAETSFPPILGYSFENPFDVDNIPPQLNALIEQWARAISRSGAQTQSGQTNNLLWERLLRNEAEPLGRSMLTDVTPMLETQWGQGQYYNAYCPQIYGQNTWVGCVATAASQIMKYWNYPEYGSGKIAFDIDTITASANMGNTRYGWDSMPNVVQSFNNAVATLCFHVAAACGTDFGTYQSGAMLWSVMKSLVGNFNYNPGATYYPLRYQTLTVAAVNEILDSNLLQGLPVLVGSRNSAYLGHAYVCDGRQGDFYHLNYGWDGYADGFYNLDSTEFNRGFELVANLKPKAKGMYISEKSPFAGQSVSVRFFTDQPVPAWMIKPNNNVTIEPDTTDPKLFHVHFPDIGLYRISLFELNGQDTVVMDEDTLTVAFSINKYLKLSGSVACGQSLPVRWFDCDNDGDLDLYYSNFWDAGLYKNVLGELIKTLNQPATYNGSFEVFDYNNDSYLDLVQTEGRYQNGKFVMDVFVYKNLSGNGFEKQNFNLPSLGGGSIIPRDFNNDGLVDLLIYGIDYYNAPPNNEYEGHPRLVILINHLTSFENVFDTTTVRHHRSENMVACNDFDNDGDIDIIVREMSNSSNSSTCKVFKNEGGTFMVTEIPFNGNTIASGDLDNNGTIDLFSPTYAFPFPDFRTGINLGYNENSAFNIVKMYVEEAFDYNRCGVSDFNCDGKSDLFLTRTRFPTQRVGFNIFLNDSAFISIPDIGTNYIGPDAHCGDYNNDGYPDVAVGGAVLLNAKGSDTYAVNTPPTAPTNLQTLESLNKVRFSWNRATDAQTPSLGLSYNLMIGSTKGGVEQMSPMSDVVTGKRRIVAMGNVYQNISFEISGLQNGKYYWSVQAIDNGYMGGMFAPIDSVVVSQSVPLNLTVDGAAADTNCYNAVDTITVAGNGTSFTLQNGGEATMIAGKNIRYLPGTTVQPGGHLRGYINPTAPFCVIPSMPANLTGEPALLTLTTERSFFKVYPNPTTGTFTLELTGETSVERVTADIYGLWGEKILTARLNGERKHEFSLSDRPVGLYLIHVITGDKSETGKIIKQ